jgi:hypothetical protein
MKRFNWLQKIAASICKTASITFSIQGSGRISQPKTLQSICHDIDQLIGDTYPRSWIVDGLLNNTIVPDAPQWDDLMGNINWYVPAQVDPSEVEPYISMAIKELALLGIDIQASQKSRSRMMHPHAYKIVLQVRNNETQNIEKIPKLNLANGNAGTILELLGLSKQQTQDSPLGPLSGPEDPEGQVTAQDLLRRIKQAYGRIQSAIRPPQGGFLNQNQPEENPYAIDSPWSQQEEQENVPGAKWTDQGMDQDKIWEILNALEEMAFTASRLQLDKNKPAIIQWG